MNIAVAAVVNRLNCFAAWMIIRIVAQSAIRQWNLRPKFLLPTLHLKALDGIKPTTEPSSDLRTHR